jgi:phosphoglycolate phosphatase-like HAD superfamily hydrolase
MDGVIIDVSASYRSVVRETVRLFFQPARGADTLPSPLFELSDLAAVKQSGGLNNDWDLTTAVIELLMPLVEYPAMGQNPSHWHRYLEIIQKSDVSAMAEFLKSTRHPLRELFQKHGRIQVEWVRSLYQEDVGSGNVIKQIFQEIYLGKSLFESTYHFAPAVYHGEGYILRETLLIEPQLLERLAAKNVLAIATGRPRAEAEYPMEQFKLHRLFTHLLTLDDCLAEEKRILETEGRTVSLSKPNPYMLDAVIQNCRESLAKIFYIGDMPDDMVAAAGCGSGCTGIGVLVSAPDRISLEKQLRKAGADFVIDRFDLLPEIIF